MPNELYIYTTPPAAAVTVTLDSGITVQGSDPMQVNGRSDAHLVALPVDTPAQGSALKVDGGGAFVPLTARGLIVPSSTGEAKFQLDDVHLAPMPTSGNGDGGGGTDPAPMPADPLGIINHTYTTGAYDLRTKQGCGEFTEACARNLYEYNFPLWGHIKKSPGQNQWNGHAVDAVMCLGGTETGIWDIIYSSESTEAHPVYNYAGPADPSLWMPPTGASSRHLVSPIARDDHPLHGLLRNQTELQRRLEALETTPAAAAMTITRAAVSALYLIALVCFALAALGVPARVNLVALGLACVTFARLLTV